MTDSGSIAKINNTTFGIITGLLQNVMKKLNFTYVFANHLATI
jgi:hypothetical protein